jgi:hypothetical protein
MYVVAVVHMMRVESLPKGTVYMYVYIWICIYIYIYYVWMYEQPVTPPPAALEGPLVTVVDRTGTDGDMAPGGRGLWIPVTLFSLFLSFFLTELAGLDIGSDLFFTWDAACILTLKFFISCPLPRCPAFNRTRLD